MIARDRSKHVLGWREWVRFPDLGVDRIKVKVDTGARTSALHAFGLEEIEREGTTYAKFEIHPVQRRSRPALPVELPILGRRRIRDSGGRVEERPVVEVAIELAGQRWPIEVTLTRRDMMGFRMLLGRRAIRGRFVVDPGSSYQAERRRQVQPALKKGKR